MTRDKLGRRTMQGCGIMTELIKFDSHCLLPLIALGFLCSKTKPWLNRKNTFGILYMVRKHWTLSQGWYSYIRHLQKEELILRACLGFHLSGILVCSLCCIGTSSNISGINGLHGSPVNPYTIDDVTKIIERPKSKTLPLPFLHFTPPLFALLPLPLFTSSLTTNTSELLHSDLHLPILYFRLHFLYNFRIPPSVSTSAMSNILIVHLMIAVHSR